jgi:hypothetical protein
MTLKHYRSRLAATTDDELRYAFLRLLAQEGRQHFLQLIAETDIGNPPDHSQPGACHTTTEVG